MNVVVDGLSLLYRSFYGLPPMRTTAGEPTGALYGFCSVLVKLLRERSPAGFALALDLPGRTIRHDQLPSYKSGRPPVPDPLRAQTRRLRDLASAAGMPVHAVPGWEADDVLASLAARVPGPLLVVSGDSDLLQLVGERTTVFFLGQRGQKNVDVDPVGFQERYGFAARCLPTFKAMAGDPSDRLPGVHGLGRASAKALCAAHGDGAEILAALDEGRIGNRRIPPVLQQVREELLRYEALGRLNADLPLEEPLVAPIDLDGLRRWFEEMEFGSLIKRLP